MKKIIKIGLTLKVVKLALTLLFMFALDSCYFNSAQHFVTQAGYKAMATTKDINTGSKKVGNVVYTDGEKYYIELPRYRKGLKIYTQMSHKAADDRWSGPQPTNETDLFEIPADFANYIAGPADSPDHPSYMTRVKDPEKVKRVATTQLPVTWAPKGEEYIEEYKYSSSCAPLWYMAGVFSWLCIDFPLSCAETVADGILLAGTAAAQFQWDQARKKGSKYGCSNCQGRGYVDRKTGETITTDGFGHYKGSTPIYDSFTCEECGGDGWNEYGRRMDNERGSAYPPPWHMNL